MRDDGKITPRKGHGPVGGRPRLEVDFVAVCDAVREAIEGNGETITAVAQRFGVSRGWIHANIYPAIRYSPRREMTMSAAHSDFEKNKKNGEQNGSK